MNQLGTKSRLEYSSACIIVMLRTADPHSRSASHGRPPQGVSIYISAIRLKNVISCSHESAVNTMFRKIRPAPELIARMYLLRSNRAPPLIMPRLSHNRGYLRADGNARLLPLGPPKPSNRTVHERYPLVYRSHNRVLSRSHQWRPIRAELHKAHSTDSLVRSTTFQGGGIVAGPSTQAMELSRPLHGPAS